jgi:hypothetical protein
MPAVMVQRHSAEGYDGRLGNFALPGRNATRINLFYKNLIHRLELDLQNTESSSDANHTKSVIVRATSHWLDRNI